MPSTALLSPSIVLLVTSLFVVRWLALRRRFKGEPPYVESRIPLVGHLIGLLSHGVEYYNILSSRTKSPMFTVDLLVNKIYVVTTASMVTQVQKHAKFLSFDFFMELGAERVAGIKQRGRSLLLGSAPGEQPLLKRVNHAMNPHLLGSGLAGLNRSMLRQLVPLVDELQQSGSTVVDLNAWCRKVITVASTEAFWGVKNPFRSSQMVDDFWTADSNFADLLFKPLPWLTAPKVYQARERFVGAHLRYAQEGGYDDDSCSPMARMRWQMLKDHGVSDEDNARNEAGLNFALLSNSAAAIFWTFFLVYSRPGLRAELQHEIESNALSIDPVTNEHKLDLSLITTACPKFVATFQEVLRVKSLGLPTRYVREDVMLGEDYLLRKGSYIHLPMTVMNQESRYWGQDASSFDPAHFDFSKHDAEGDTPPTPRPRGSSFLSFGTTPHLCPGRHFASAEIISVVAIMLLRADMEPVQKTWWVPPRNTLAIAAITLPIKGEYPVQLSWRDQFKDAKWSFVVTGTKEKFGLIVG